MPESPNPGQSYEAWIESKAGASPVARGGACVDYGHDYEYLEESNVTVCRHCGDQPAAGCGSTRNEPA